jgi:hypothetical protein
MAKPKIPLIDREQQVKQMNELFPGAVVKSIKDDGKGIISLEFETVGVIIFANPSAIGLGLYEVPEGEQPNV